MASAAFVVTGSSSDTPAVGNLFAGLKFFLLRRIPSRSRWQEGIEANGGSVVPVEASADYVIADHMRPDAPGGSYSWTFIENALKNGRLPDPGDHATGVPQDIVRDVGSARPPRGTRTPFTREDDLLLWNWVEREKTEGKSEKGNEMYKRLEAAHSRHTFQSWRDRYIKKLMGKAPAGAHTAVSTTLPPSPPTDAFAEGRAEAIQRHKHISPTPVGTAEEPLKTENPKTSDFSVEDFDIIMQEADDIEAIDEAESAKAWAVWSEGHGHHSSGAWCWFWETVVRPAWLKQKLQESHGEDHPRQSKQEQPFTIDDFEKQILGSAKRKRAISSSTNSTPATSRKRRAMFVDDDHADRATDTRTAPSPQPEHAPHIDNINDVNAVHDGSISPPQLPSESMLTSDLNRKADQQIREEANRDSSQSLDTQLPTEEHLIAPNASETVVQVQIDAVDENAVVEASAKRPATADANREADEQLQQPWVNDGETVQRPSALVSPRIVSSPATATLQQAHSASVRRQRSTSPTSSLENLDWTAAEDELVLKGVRAGWSSPYISGLLSTDNKRTSSAVRARKVCLKLSRSDEYRLPAKKQQELDIVNHHRDFSENVRDQGPQHSPDSGAGAGDLLTEANLASQQAQHKSKTHRGADIPQDEQSEDQLNMAAYLQKLLGVSNSSNVIDVSNDDNESAEDQGSDDMPSIRETQAGNTEEQYRVSYPRITPNPVGFVPLSSQQEIDDALENVFTWPNSPEQHKRKDVDPQPATQVSYPLLPRAQLEDGNERDVFFLDQDRDDREETLLEIELPAAGSHDEEQDMEAAQENQDEATGEYSAFGDEIDLMIASPPGGFQSLDFTSSPQQQLSQQKYQDQQVKEEAEEEQSMSPAPSTSRPAGVVELSSDASSSSYRSSEPEEPLLQRGQSLIPGSEHFAHQGLGGSRASTEETGYSESHASLQAVPERQAIETQDILNAETQAPDLEMLLPPESDFDPEEPSREPSSSRARPETHIPLYFGDEEQQQYDEYERVEENEKEGAEEDIETFIATMKLRGFHELSIIKALQRTSQHQDLAQLVLLEEKLGHDLPTDIPGIWSEMDDELLMSTDATVLRKLDEVHGEHECEVRRRFLEAQ